MGVTGSVATIKAKVIIEELKKKIDNVEIILVPTQSALHFLPPKLQELNVDKIHLDQDEWDSWKGRGDPVLHIELRKWADILILAPLREQSIIIS